MSNYNGSKVERETLTEYGDLSGFADELSAEDDAGIVHAGVPVVAAEGQPLQPARLAEEESQAADDGTAGDAHPRDTLQGQSVSKVRTIMYYNHNWIV